MHSSPRFRSRRVPRWDPEQAADDEDDSFLSASDLAKTLQPVPRRPTSQGRRHVPQRGRVWPPMDSHAPLGFSDWPFDGADDSRPPMEEDYRSRGSKLPARRADGLEFEPDVLQNEDYNARARPFQATEQPRHSQAQLQRYQQQNLYQRTMQREFGDAPMYRRGFDYDRDPRDEIPFDPPRRIPRTSPASGTATSSPLASFALRPNGLTRDAYGRVPAGRRHPTATHSPSFGARVDELPLEAALDMYRDEEIAPPAQATARRRDYAPPQRHRLQQDARRPHSAGTDGDLLNERLGLPGANLVRGGEGRIIYNELAPPPSRGAAVGQQNAKRPAIRNDIEAGVLDDAPLSRQRQGKSPTREQNAKRPRLNGPPAPSGDSPTSESPSLERNTKTKLSNGKKSPTATSTGSNDEAAQAETKRRCGRKSMNYSSEQKRERNRAAVKKCRQRQALKLEYLQHKAESLAAENQALSEMLVKNTELDEEQRTSLTRGIQMDILLKIKEIFTQSLPKDFVLDADSIWDLNSVLAVSMPSRCYYGIDSIKDFWRTSLRMRNKGKIRSFWAWLFRLPPGDRFSEFDIQPFSPKSNLYFISWTTKSTPPLAGSMVIMFGNGHRVTLHVECFGWLIWRYLLTNEPFPEPSVD